MILYLWQKNMERLNKQENRKRGKPMTSLSDYYIKKATPENNVVSNIEISIK